MNKTPNTPIPLPFGSKPDWELQGKDDIGKEDKRSISESCVLIQALRQSRDKWLYSTFPRFSSKVRGGKATEPPPPPHTIQTRGKCDLEIGPHVFPDTIFYEVHYLPSQPSSIVGPTYQPPTTGSWQTKTSYMTVNQSSTAPANTAKPLDSDKTPLASNLTSVATITPALIHQVNSAASSNPTLANLLQLAAAGLATPDQLKTLGLLIQSLATSESTQPVPPPLVATSTLPPLPKLAPAAVITPTIASVKEFDLVLEFRENPSERWVFPRGLITCERTKYLPAVNALSQTVIKACLPFTKPVVSEALPLPGQAPLANRTVEEPQVATFILERTPLSVWDTISRWAGNQEKLQQNKIKLDAMKPIEYTYLGYRLSEGPLLSQLQTASAPTYTMKSLKAVATAATRAKRKATNKPKVAAQQIHQNPQDTESVEKPPPTKRKRASHQFERPPAPPIQCVSCKSQDVPLILGGRFCRPCVEAGHATTSTQPVHPYRFSSYVPPSTPPIPPPTTTTTTSLDIPK